MELVPQVPSRLRSLMLSVKAAGITKSVGHLSSPEARGEHHTIDSVVAIALLQEKLPWFQLGSLGSTVRMPLFLTSCSNPMNLALRL
jgi:hypothetical protein